MNANERRFIARVYIALNRLFFFCGAVQESGGITAKRAESAKRWRRGGEGRMGGGDIRIRGGAIPVQQINFININ